jgi:hypothetical protein
VTMKAESKNLAQLLRDLGQSLSRLTLFPQLFEFRYYRKIPDPGADAEAVIYLATQIEKECSREFIDLNYIVKECRTQLFGMESSIAPRYWNSFSVLGSKVNELFEEWIGRFIKESWGELIDQKSRESEKIKNAWTCASGPIESPFIFCNRAPTKNECKEWFYFDGSVREYIIEIFSNVVHRSMPVKHPNSNFDQDMWYEIAWDSKNPVYLQIEFSNACQCDKITLKSTRAKVGLENMGGRVTTDVVRLERDQDLLKIAKTVVHIPSVSYATTEKPG